MDDRVAKRINNYMVGVEDTIIWVIIPTYQNVVVERWNLKLQETISGGIAFDLVEVYE